jgi:Fe-S oxidoreductase
MAGAFGYEQEHYDLSLAVAEDRLLPALRACDGNTRIVATGFSCRHQIADSAGREAIHPLQLIDRLIRPYGR